MPYVVEGLVEEVAQRAKVISEHATGVDLFIDLEVIDPKEMERTKRLLQNALAALEEQARKA